MIYQSQIETFIYNLIVEPLKEIGYDIARIRILQIENKKVVQIMLDKNDGSQVNVADCEKASHYISTLLDVEDPIKVDYNLEVSSTGLDRPMTREKDFAAAVGKTVKLATRVAIDGQKRFSGKIIAFSDKIVLLELKDSSKTVSINFNTILEAHLDYFASTESKNTKKPKNKKKSQGGQLS